jgi:chemotaxis methyl-accepting protein methylase
LALYFTGFSRIASEIAREQVKVMPHKRQELETMLQLVEEAEEIIANPSRPIVEFGRLLNERWKIKRSLTQKISNASIDEIYEAGISAGAVGGKLLGAGGGGFLAVLRAPGKAGSAARAAPEPSLRSIFVLNPRQRRDRLRARGAIRSIISDGARTCLWTEWCMTMPSNPQSTVCAAEDVLTAAAKPGVRRRLLAFYRLQLTRVWTRLPEGIRRSPAGRAYGRHLHAMVCRTSDRQQYVATFFLRNRPELQLMCRLLDRKPSGSTVNLSVLACSKGAEVYSIAWAIRSARPDLQLRIHALDISRDIVEFAGKGVYSRNGVKAADAINQDSSAMGDRVAWNTCRDQGNGSIFERLTPDEFEQMFDIEGDFVVVKPYLKEGIIWLHGDASGPELIDLLGPQDIVVANRFLCHMDPRNAEKCLHNIARLVSPGGYLFVSGIDLDVRKRVAAKMKWRPVRELLREIHEGDASLRSFWPLEYWGLEPFCGARTDCEIRYASVFKLGEKAGSCSSLVA